MNSDDVHELVQALPKEDFEQRRINKAAYRYGELLRGRLRSGILPTRLLAELKRELRDFNLNTRKWKAQ